MQSEVDGDHTPTPPEQAPYADDQAGVVEFAQRLVGWFAPQTSYVVALSGGVDSAVVAMAAKQSQAIVQLATARSPAVSAVELSDVEQLVTQLELPHRFLSTTELSVAGYVANGPDRCFHCKSELFTRVVESFPEHVILTGTNADDLQDFRPGLRAAEKHQVRSPLAELGVVKRQVRQLASLWGLPVSSKPASPCLSSRIAHGVAVTGERLARVEAAETVLREMGLVEFRVRMHADDLARVEVPAEAIAVVVENRESITARLCQIGFRYVTLDLEPFRSGSQNAVYRIDVP